MVRAKLSQAASFGPLQRSDAVAGLIGPVQVVTGLASETVPPVGVDAWSADGCEDAATANTTATRPILDVFTVCLHVTPHFRRLRMFIQTGAEVVPDQPVDFLVQ